MLGRQQKLEFNQDELVVIESALHTQAKILNVQASAGGSTARNRLNEVQKILAQIEGHREHEETATQKSAPGWFGIQSKTG